MSMSKNCSSSNSISVNYLHFRKLIAKYTLSCCWSFLYLKGIWMLSILSKLWWLIMKVSSVSKMRCLCTISLQDSQTEATGKNMVLLVVVDFLFFWWYFHFREMVSPMNFIGCSTFLFMILVPPSTYYHFTQWLKQFGCVFLFDCFLFVCLHSFIAFLYINVIFTRRARGMMYHLDRVQPMV